MKAEQSDKPDWRYPRTYRIDRATRRLFSGFAIFLVVLFSVTTCLHLMGAFARPLAHRDLIWMDSLILLFAILSFAWTNRSAVLHKDSIEATGWFGSGQLKRDEIRGVRMGRLPVIAGGASYYVIVPTINGKRDVKLPPFLHTDQQFRSWIESLPRLSSER